MNDERPTLPAHDWRAAAGDHPDAHAAIDAFHEAYHAPEPDRARLDEHARRLRGIDALAAPFERWWLEPRVQAFVAELGATGI